MPVSRRKYDDLQTRYKNLADNHEELKEELTSSRRALLRLSGQYTHLLETGEPMPMFSQPSRVQQRITDLEGRLDEALAACRAAERRAEHLQKRLDDAVGLPVGRIEDSRPWQPAYQDPKEDAS